MSPRKLKNFAIDPGPDLTATRDELVTWGKGEIDRVRTWINDNIALGRGLHLTHTHSDVIDTVVCKVFAWVEKQGGGPLKDLALLAQGGYGRRHMCHHSDIDLLVLVADQTTKKAEARVRDFIQVMWDLGREIGHGVRSVKEALAVVGEDIVSTTALFEARHLAGDMRMSDELHSGIRKSLERGVLSEYLKQNIDAMRGRHAKFGNTVYLLEPNVKEGEGGLRDIHLCSWITFACLGSPELHVLVEEEIISDDELEEMRTSRDFLLVVRNALHIVTNRHVDTLDFSRQRQVAQLLEIEPTESHASPEEHLLHLFHRHAKVIDRMTKRAAHILPERTTVAQRLTRRFQQKRLRGGWIALQGDISVDPAKPEDLFEQDPGQMLEICAVARERGLRINEETREQIRAALPACDDAFRADSGNTDRWLRILRGPAHVAQTVRAMHDTGLLAAYLPEWERIQNMVRIDSYHRYTVDEHTLKCLEAAEAMITGAEDEQSNPLIPAAHRIVRWDLLMFGILLHDIGKGYGRGHVVRGGQIAQRIAQRQGLDDEEAEILRQLVLGHLWIPHLAFRRDISDAKVIAGLAQQCRNAELLDLIAVLTVADIKGVNPENWSAWKAQLISGLHRATRDHLLTGGEVKVLAGPDPEEQFSEIASEIEGGPTPEQADSIRTLLNSASRRYRRSVRPSRIVKHAALLSQVRGTTTAAWLVEHPNGMNFSEVTVAVPDDQGIFHLMCGALSSKDINILSAQGYSFGDGVAIETFQVSAPRGGPLPSGFKLDRLEKQVNRVLSGEVKAEEVFPVRALPMPDDRHERATTQIEVDNDTSSRSTVLEVRTLDRPGLLHAITHLLAKAGFMIYLAMITTEAYRVVDVFYLTDLDGLKIDDPKKLRTLEEDLRRLLDGDEDTPEN